MRFGFELPGSSFEFQRTTSAEPGDLEAARSHLHALLGQVTLKPKDGVLWAHPTLKTKGLTESLPSKIKKADPLRGPAFLIW